MKNLITYLSKKSLSLGNGSGMVRDRFEIGSAKSRKWFEIGSVYSRLSLGSNLSRFSLASLICLCMLTLGSGNVWGDTYTITFATGSNDGTKASASTEASTCTTEATYVTGNLVTASNTYYSGSSGLKLGTSSNAGDIKFNLSAAGQVVPTKVSVYAKYYNSSKKKTVQVCTNLGSNTATTTTGSFAEYSYSYSGSTALSYIEIKSSGYIWVEKVVVTYTASCTTDPTVTAGSYSSVTATTATVSCSRGISLLSSSGCSITSYGFVLGTSANPTIDNTVYEVGTSYTTTGTAFSKELTGLTANTTYYVRPYATNGNGTAYGTQTSFTTPALPKYTVTLKDDNSTLTQASAGASVTLPSRTGCTGYTFAGWTKSWVAAQTEWTTTAPDIIPAGSYTPEADENLYPVYTKTEGGGNGFKLSLNSDGTDYYIGAKGSGSYMSAVTDPADAVVFTYDNNRLSFDNSGTQTYISSAGDNTTLTVGTNQPSSTWTESGSSTYTYQSSASGNRYLAFNGSVSPARFAPYGSSYAHEFTKHSLSTTSYISEANCVACDNKVTISKGSESHGTFELNKTGEQDACDALSVTITPSPAEHYHVASVSATDPATTGTAGTAVNNGDGTWTITYSANSKGASTVNVTFEADQQYTVNWYVNGSIAHSQTGYEGATLTGIPTPTSSDCDGSKVFVGWYTSTYSHASDAPAYVSPTTIPNGGANYYAVFATASGGGGAAIGTTIFSEDFSSFKSGDKMTGSQSSASGRTIYNSGSVTYSYENGTSADTKIYAANNAGGTSPELLVGKNSSTFTISGIPNGGASELTLSYKQNGQALTSSVSGTGYTGGVFSNSSGTTSTTITVGSSASFDLTFTGPSGGDNVRLDDISITVKTNGVSYSDYSTSCCQQPATQLSMTADKTELVRSGAVNFTLTGGNGKNITWSCRDESDVNCDALLTNTSNSGATLTISSPVAATKTYTVKAVQPENDDDAEVVCGKTVTMDITVKAQWTITFKTTDDGSLSTYSTETVTDGDTYTFPDLSDDYTCETNYSFVGWRATNTAGAPEHAGGSSAKATESTTWYAVWMYSTGTTTITRDKYELVTSTSTAIAENDVVVIACNTQGVALAQMSTSDTYGSPVAVDFAADKSYLTFASGTNVMELKIIWHSGSYDGWAFEDYNNASHYISYSGSGGSLYYLNGSLWMWDIAFTAQNNATISDVEPASSSYSIQYNSSNSKFAFYSSSQKKVQLYRKNGTVSVEVPAAPTYYVNNEHCTNGATIRAAEGQWVTSAKDQKVRITVPVTAKNFETSGKQMSATSDNIHFAVSMASHTIPSDKSEVEVQMTVEYTPTEANTIEEANITITTGTGDGNATKVISVNGRSLPDEFVIVTQKEGKWQALPADMFSGTGTYSPIEVTPNGGITAIPAAPYTTIYSAREVASGRYESAGTCMRLVGNNNKCLWANSSGNGTGIQNFAALGNTNGAQYEWLLSTADGEQYTIANPAHPDYATGRQLGIYTLKYGLYKTTDIFYLLPVGCSSQPGNLQITPRRVDAMFSWETNTASVTIDLWTNEAMSEGHQQAVVTSVPYQFTGLTENTDYWYKITPGSDDDCALTGSFSTTGPTIELVEWGENSATIFVDKDEAVDPQIIIAGEVEHGQGSGAAATDIFFSKYFEAEGNAKMLAIYNGTGNALSLANITILQRSTNYSNTKKYTPLSLASYGKTAGWIQPGEEIILFNKDSREAVMSCAVNDPTYKSWNNVENANLEFSGKGTIRLFRGDECIDIIGAMAKGDDIDDKAVNPIEGSVEPSFGDAQGFVSTSGDDYTTKGTVENDYKLSTNRCLLIRQNWVTSGDSAVLNNFDDFKTLGTYTGVDSKTHKGEWAGLQVPDAVAPEADYIHTCEGFQEVGKFDYNKYYREYTQIGADKHLSDFTRAADGTYTLPIAYMRQYACLNLKFQLTEHDNKANVLTEQTVQVPIVVKDARNSNDTLFNNIIKADEAPHTPMVPQSIERCKTCNVVVLSTGTLTKATDGATNDVAEVRDVKVYPGGKLIVPEGTHYVINSLSLRRQEDEIASAKLDAGLSSDPSDVSKKGLYIRESNGVYLDVRIDPRNWHYFTLPYDCRVGDIRFSDGTPAKVNNDYLLSWYDGAYRAEHKDGGWTDITEEDYVLKKGLGYIVALPGDGLIKRELRFPMANEVISAELANKEVGGLYAYGGDKTDEELRPNHKGWNMIGNPYLYDYTTDIVKSPLATGKLIHDPSSPWNGQWVRTGSARYIVEPIDNGWTGYRQTTISNLKPFTSYFIQVGTKTDGTDNPETERNITFNKTSKASISRRNMPAEEAEEPMYPVWYGIEMTAPNAEKDNTTLLISDEFTDGYDMMDDLIKMRGSYYQYYPYPVLASRNNEGEMAFNALPDSSAAVIGIPLNYYAAQAGTYTIRTDSRFDLEEVKSAMLFDATTNQYNDLLAGDYSFTTAKGDNTNRFTLFVRVERKKTPTIATGTDNILENGKLSLIAIDRTLVLSGLTEDADIYVYDMSGKLIKGERNAGEGVWRANVPAQGVYFVRVNGISGQQTLRTIVK